MSRHVELMRQLEDLVESVESDHGASSIRALAARAVERFGDQLGITGGRVYVRDGADYILTGSFPAAAGEVPRIRVPDTYGPIDLVLQRRFIYMRPGDPELDPELEEVIGARDFAAIWIGGALCDCILAFDVAPGAGSDEIRHSLVILRHSINHRLRESWLGGVLKEARMIQASILPRRPPVFGSFDLAGRSSPVEGVGGDFYDFIPLSPKLLGLAIADVSGHGLPAALQTRDIYMGLRMGLSLDFKIVRTVERLNRIVSGSTLTSRFVSMFYGELELNGNFIYVNAGHPPPLHLDRAGRVHALVEGGAVLGPLPDGAYERGFLRLRAGDSLVLYTDGIVETEGNAGAGVEEYGMDRLLHKAGECVELSAADTVAAIFEDVQRFGASVRTQDDRTLVVLKYPPG
ncbi:MAG: PP2C family protein-serine/threonine phosphatase [Acidobacteriota bacterium]|nr:PP2C family protein-serine/threonine phosphatase [Acidobacteriota bacterium]MDH3522607.1 PP2C family protein-serine/threonine phosphatase [Acidobacteriota bacterium]